MAYVLLSFSVSQFKKRESPMLHVTTTVAVLVSVFMSVVGCRSLPIATRLSADEVVGPGYLHKLSTRDDYLSLVRNEQGLTFVKMTIELNADGTPIYFQNTARYDFHLPFLKAELQQYATLTASEYEDMLFGPAKSVTAGAIYHSETLKLPDFATPGVLGFNIYFDGTVDLNEIVAAHAKLKAAAPFAEDKIAYVFESTALYLQNKAALKALGVTSARVSQLVGQGDGPVVYNAAKSYGYIKQVTAEQIADGDYTSKDILVMTSVPLDIGPSAGIITTEAQIPHSHVILRAINLKIPNIAIPNGLNVSAVASHLGQLIELETKLDGTYSIKGKEEIPEAELLALAQAYFEGRVPHLPEPSFDLSATDLYVWKSRPVSRDLAKAYGSKGTNFAILDKALRADATDRSLYEGSFMIPFSYYNRFVTQSLKASACSKAKSKCESAYGADACSVAVATCAPATASTVKAYLDNMVQETNVTAMMANAKVRKAQLLFARELMEAHKMDAGDVTTIANQIRTTYPDNRRIRFRSSTNSEDLAGFNGAGLYESKSGCLADDAGGDGSSACLTPLEKTRKEALIAKLKTLDPVKNAVLIADLEDDLVKKQPLDKAIKKVFASLWGEKAFLTRDYYRIDHSKIFMGILVHPSFIEESANGVVLVTEKDDGKLEIDAVVQTDDISITNPEIPGARPDRFIMTSDDNSGFTTPSYKLHSNQVGAGETVLTPAQVTDTARQLMIVFQALKAEYTGAAWSNRIDVEVMADHDGKILIKQARPL